jgi:hypothetical protein
MMDMLFLGCEITKKTPHDEIYGAAFTFLSRTKQLIAR